MVNRGAFVCHRYHPANASTLTKATNLMHRAEDCQTNGASKFLLHSTALHAGAVGSTFVPHCPLDSEHSFHTPTVPSVLCPTRTMLAFPTDASSFVACQAFSFPVVSLCLCPPHRLATQLPHTIIARPLLQPNQPPIQPVRDSVSRAHPCRKPWLWFRNLEVQQSSVLRKGRYVRIPSKTRNGQLQHMKHRFERERVS